jgi:hypothetical protein
MIDGITCSRRGIRELLLRGLNVKVGKLLGLESVGAPMMREVVGEARHFLR